MIQTQHVPHDPDMLRTVTGPTARHRSKIPWSKGSACLGFPVPTPSPPSNPHVSILAAVAIALTTVAQSAALPARIRRPTTIIV
jgi:hypothetical protein